MFQDPLLILVILSCLVVLVILAVGIGGFAKGGEFNQKYGNKLMRARIAAQAVAVVMLFIYILFGAK